MGQLEERGLWMRRGGDACVAMFLQVGGERRGFDTEISLDGIEIGAVVE